MLSFLCHGLSAGTSAYCLWLNYSYEGRDCRSVTRSLSMTVRRLTRRVPAIVRWWRGWKWSVLTSLHQPLFSSPPAPRHLALIHPIFLFFSPRLWHIQISADEITSTAAATQQHVMMMHVLVELIIWISAKAKTVHAKRLTAVWMPRSRGIGGERSSWRGERVSEMKLQLRRFILTIHSHFWQLICWWVLWFKGKIAFLLAL